MMEGDDISLQLAKTFSANILNIVYRDHNVPLLGYEYNDLYVEVGKFIISLIKGNLRNNFGRDARRVLQRAKTNDERSDILMRFPDLYFREKSLDYMTILKAIAFIAMYSIFYHLYDVEHAQVYAHNAVAEMLIKLEDGQFVQRGGLSLLHNYAERLFDNEEEYLISFEQGTYPW